MFTLTMHPASDGDCLQLSWGMPNDLHHALIDLGRSKNYKALAPRLKELANVELLVISHIDADHIEGAMPMVKASRPPFTPTDVWYNGYHHLEAAVKRRAIGMHPLSVIQAEKLSEGIHKFGWPWNAAFAPSRIVSVDSPLAAPIVLPGGLKITLLSPGDGELAALEPDWASELEDAHLRPFDPDLPDQGTVPGVHALSVLNVEALASEPFKPDCTTPNGSSIAFLAEYEDRSVLLGADAFPTVLERSLAQLRYSKNRKLKVDLFKVSHHGSKANTSPALLEMLDCTRFAISTDGSRHGHPDTQSIARILKNDPRRAKELFFNTAQPKTDVWKNATLQNEYKYNCIFPDDTEFGLTINI